MTDAARSPIQQESVPGSGYLSISWLFIAIAIGFVIWGMVRMFTYDELSDKLVGGDAYNYIVLTIRGVGLIAVGCASAALAATFAIFARMSRSGHAPW
jgi:hypothetical protein